jgi:hypothetical protein
VRGLIAAVIGIPATIVVAGGIGLIGTTVYSRLVRSLDRQPIRWARLGAGVALVCAGVLLLSLEVMVVGINCDPTCN